MITLNGKKFAETEAEFTDSLFDTGGTCVGYAKRLKRAIKLFNPQRDLIGVINGHGCLAAAHKMPDGKTWYNFATIKEVGEYRSYRQSVEEPMSLATHRVFDPAQGCYNLTFK